MMEKFHERFVVNSDASINQMAKKLEPLPGFKRKTESENRGVFTVGSKLKLALKGTMLDNNYIAPVKIDIKRSGSEATVDIYQNYPLPFYNVSSMVEFYQRTAERIGAALATDK